MRLFGIGVSAYMKYVSAIPFGLSTPFVKPMFSSAPSTELKTGIFLVFCISITDKDMCVFSFKMTRCV